MTSDPHLGEVVEGYADLANALLQKWSPYLATMANAPADYATVFPAGAKLVAESMFAIGAESFDAIEVMTSAYDEQMILSGYSTDPARAATPRTLSVATDLTSVSGAVLPKHRVQPLPSTLLAGVTAFELEFNGAGLKARTYDGIVTATDAAGDVEEIPISVTIG